MIIVARFERGAFWGGADGYRIIQSNDPDNPVGTRFDWAKAMYDAQENGYTLELKLIH